MSANDLKDGATKRKILRTSGFVNKPILYSNAQNDTREAKFCLLKNDRRKKLSIFLPGGVGYIVLIDFVIQGSW